MRLLRKHPLTLAANLRFAAPRAPSELGPLPARGERGKEPYSAAVASGASSLRKRASNVAPSSRAASRFFAFTGP